MTIDRIALRALVDMLIDRSTSALTVDTIRARLASAVPDLLTELDSLELQLANDRREAQDALERAATRPIGGGAVGGRLAEMETQLETAKHEIQRLTKHNNEIACALGVEGELDAAVAYAAWEARGHAEALASLSDRRDESCSMTVDREELRRLIAEQGDFERGLHQEIEFGRAALEAMPGLLDKLDAAERRIAGLERDLANSHTIATDEIERQNRIIRQDAEDWAALRSEHAALRLRLQVATDANVADRMRIDELESSLTDMLKIASLGSGPVSPASARHIERAKRLLAGVEVSNRIAELEAERDEWRRRAIDRGYR